MLLQYTDLDASTKKSFYRSTQLTIFELIDRMTIKDIEEDFVTELFVNVVVEELMKKRGFQNWANMDFEIDDKEMKELVQTIVERRRKYKPTKKQKEYYLGLTSKLEEEEVLPNDFLVFQKRLVEMKDRLQKKTFKKPLSGLLMPIIDLNYLNIGEMELVLQLMAQCGIYMKKIYYQKIIFDMEDMVELVIIMSPTLISLYSVTSFLVVSGKVFIFWIFS